MCGKSSRFGLLVFFGLATWLLPAATFAEPVGVFGPLTIEVSRTPTVDLPGFSTWKLTARSELGIYGFDFFGPRNSQPGDPSARGFFGPMNQVHPFGVMTVFDNVDVCPVCELVDNSWTIRDSHFLVGATPIVVLPGFAIESSTHLRAVFARQDSPSGNSWDFAQLVLPDAAQGPVHYRGVVVVGPPDKFQEIEVSGLIPPVPEPASCLLAVLAAMSVMCLFRHCALR
jgi:hypothetical protein